MCGPTSAIGLEQHERDQWASVRDLLREPGTLIGLMRGFLGEEEVAVGVRTDPSGAVRPVAVLVTPFIRSELTVAEPTAAGEVQQATIGEYEVEIVLADGDDEPRPAAVLMTPWMREHLFLYARQLWRGR